MIIQELAQKKIPWISDDGIVLSSRIRLARNLRGYAFPAKCDKKVQAEVFERIAGAITDKCALIDPVSLRLNEHDKVERLTLMERHLISHEMALREKGEPGVIFAGDERISIMVNEEDHLRVQILSPGIAFGRQWEALSRLDDELCDAMHFCYSGKYGYLTSCPTNTGTGLRVSCLMHLSALVLKKEIEKLVKWLEKSSIGARGFYGEGTKPLGDIFQISNVTTLGRSEEEIIGHFEKVVHAIAAFEKKACESLDTEEKAKLEDAIWRSYALLKHAKMMDSGEAIFHLTKLRTGALIGLNLGIDPADVNQLIFKIQPGHLQALAGKDINTLKRDIMRANLIQSTLFTGEKNDPLY